MEVSPFTHSPVCPAPGWKAVIRSIRPVRLRWAMKALRKSLTCFRHTSEAKDWLKGFPSEVISHSCG